MNVIALLQSSYMKVLRPRSHSPQSTGDFSPWLPTRLTDSDTKTSLNRLVVPDPTDSIQHTYSHGLLEEDLDGPGWTCQAQSMLDRLGPMIEGKNLVILYPRWCLMYEFVLFHYSVCSIPGYRVRYRVVHDAVADYAHYWTVRTLIAVTYLHTFYCIFCSSP